MYLINKNIEFCPELYQLVNRENGGQPISLPVSAGRCLLALLANRRLVTQQELFEFAWGEQHSEITPNNLYQNISILRKTLKIMDGNAGNWINTVPKKGFIFNLNIAVEEIISDNIQADETTEEISIAESTIKNKPLLLKPIINNKHKFISLSYVILAAIIFLVVINLPPKKQVSESFVFYKKIGACLVYINDDMQEKDIHEKVLEQLNPNCSKFPHIYITAYSIMHSATILACNKPINGDKPHCVSLLLRGVRAS
ncbi:winged helix-turn-helix domain-containing protein [Enterobacteriaceae bacterium H20N1]|uniref:Winged helix-turn-helix domain-containing protein n=1 Tax=Dryocola boscaweniae TaxID=2925397 RepID=A0A9X3AQP4_9ENTR|nr:winged helix-turn-helix domain-containing protein [Dryocola boscaweniae]MCT4703355.1 winged helix-turn-helix domain-containing protein [Dryocola boscaweniae]MCT4720523.1 winged helix-turn-helix domain-containing protein [Dryocola boscaweniae]